jgi:hypothetical protein
MFGRMLDGGTSAAVTAFSVLSARSEFALVP